MRTTIWYGRTVWRLCLTPKNSLDSSTEWNQCQMQWLNHETTRPGHLTISRHKCRSTQIAKTNSMHTLNTARRLKRHETLCNRYTERITKDDYTFWRPNFSCTRPVRQRVLRTWKRSCVKFKRWSGMFDWLRFPQNLMSHGPWWMRSTTRHTIWWSTILRRWKTWHLYTLLKGWKQSRWNSKTPTRLSPNPPIKVTIELNKAKIECAIIVENLVISNSIATIG